MRRMLAFVRTDTKVVIGRAAFTHRRNKSLNHVATTATQFRTHMRQNELSHKRRCTALAAATVAQIRLVQEELLILC